MTKELAPRGGFEPPTFRLTAERMKNLSALSGVAYEKLGAIFPALVVPKPAPTSMTSERIAIGARSGPLTWPIHGHFPERDSEEPRLSEWAAGDSAGDHHRQHRVHRQKDVDSGLYS